MNSAAATTIRPQSVKLISRFLRIMTDEDLVTVPEANTIIAELKHLAERGENLPTIMAKLIDQEDRKSVV